MKRACAEEMSLTECVLGTLSSLSPSWVPPCPASCLAWGEGKNFLWNRLLSPWWHLILDAETLRPVTTDCTSEALSQCAAPPFKLPSGHSEAKVTTTGHYCWVHCRATLAMLTLRQSRKDTQWHFFWGHWGSGSEWWTMLVLAPLKFVQYLYLDSWPKGTVRR